MKKFCILSQMFYFISQRFALYPKGFELYHKSFDVPLIFPWNWPTLWMQTVGHNYWLYLWWYQNTLKHNWMKAPQAQRQWAVQKASSFWWLITTVSFEHVFVPTTLCGQCAKIKGVLSGPSLALLSQQQPFADLLFLWSMIKDMPEYWQGATHCGSQCSWAWELSCGL